MPKLKTRKSLTKRFKITKTGKVMRRRGFARHLKSKKKGSQLRNLARVAQVKDYHANKIKKALGY